MAHEKIKDLVGAAAASLVTENMLVGLGTGSTAHAFLRHLILRCRGGLDIRAVASSAESHRLAKEGGIPLLDINEVDGVDIYFDGADELDNQKRMIKGGGGALVREKILASISREMVVMVDESKLVSKLGTRPLPVEVIPFALKAQENRFRKLGYKGSWRKQKNGSLFISDNGNMIYDITFDHPRESPENDHELLIHLPGVVDTGFFFNLAGRVLIGFPDGKIITA